jgi:hypothetical protein
MTVAAHQGHAGKRDPLLRADDVHDALAGLVHVVVADTLGAAAFPQDDDFPGPAALAVAPPRRGRDRMVGGGEYQTRIRDCQIALSKLFYRVGATQVVQKNAIHVQEIGAVLQRVDDVDIPQLVEQRACAGGLITWSGQIRSPLDSSG